MTATSHGNRNTPHSGPRTAVRRLLFARLVVLLFALLGIAPAIRAADDRSPPKFYRAFNLNGPALAIDGHAWEAGDATGLSGNDSAVADGSRPLGAFEDQSVRLRPAADESRSKMLRSSRYASSGKAMLRVTGLPTGTYSVYLHVWEDNDPQRFDVSLGGQVVQKGVDSGAAGHWQRLGPWVIDVSNGTLELRTVGGHANLSGLEIWSGRLSGTDNSLKPVETRTVAPPTLAARAAGLLARHCLECHNSSDRKGELDLTRREAALKGGESGAALQPGDAAASLLWKKVEAREMPPRGRNRLSNDEQRLLEEWIRSGAKWDTDPIDPFLVTSDRRAGYNWWSLQQLKPVTPPEVTHKNWPINDIDRFVLHRLEAAGLEPSPEADRRTLFRRLSFDLTGLPPDPDEADQFVADPDPQAYEQLVDRLLASPHAGERQARRWLDIIRFGESQGFERNKLRDNAWKYRDFVVEAFHSDLPYDDFIRWQIAGDVLHPDNPLAVIASGFLTMGPYDLTAYTTGTSDMRAAAREEELEGLVGTVSQTFLGLTVNCSRCHDHKFDPVTQREYYQVSAALGGTFHGDERESLSAAARAVASRQIEALQEEDRQLAAREAAAKTAHNSQEQRRLAEQRFRNASLARLLSGGKTHTTVPQQPGEWHILARGDFRSPGDVVAPRGIAAVSGPGPDWKLNDDAPEAARRIALAQWIAHPDNPLTPRVLVNRLWGWHFGEALVRTPSDLGFQGGLPSHPELLDWLASELVHPTGDAAWSMRRMQKLIVLSASYRQASRHVARAAALDADNRLVWRRPPQRLEAETFRDAILSVSGDLDLKMGGPGFRDFKITSAGNNETYTVFDGLGSEFNRRSLYRTWVRAGTSPLLDTLDCPDPSVATPRRAVTSTPLQALSLLNDAFIEHSAGRFAERLKRDAGDDPLAQVRRAYALCFARAPSPAESTFARDFIAAHGLAQFAIVLFNSSEFLFVD